MRHLLLLFILIPFTAAAEITVTGRVLDSDRKPLKQAEIALTTLLDPVTIGLTAIQGESRQVPVARASTDESGQYVLKAPDAGLWKVRVDAKGYLSEETILSPLIGDEQMNDLTLTKAGEVKLKITNADGSAVQNALIRVENQKQRDYLFSDPWKPVIRYALTSADGSAAINIGTTERVLLSAYAVGAAFHELKDTRASMLNVSLTPGVPQEIRVLSKEGRPISGAAIMLGDSEHPIGLTNEKGSIDVRLRAKTGVRFTLRTRDGRMFKGEINADPEKKEPRIVRLPALSILKGIVLDEVRRTPIPNAFVWSTEARWNVAKTERNGSFQLSGSRIMENIKTAAPGYTDETIPELDYNSSITIALTPGSSLQGRVVNKDGEGLANVELQLFSGFRGFMAETRYLPVPAKKISGENGDFRFERLNAERGHKLIVRSPGFAVHVTEFGRFKPGESRKNIRIELSKGLIASGKVLTHTKDPAPGVQITLKRSITEKTGRGILEDDQTEETWTAPSDRSGMFEIKDLGPGKYDLTASGEGFSSKTLQGIEVLDSNKPASFGEIILEPGIRVEGRILDEGKNGIEGAEIIVEAATHDARYMYDDGTQPEPAAISGLDGWFVIQDQTAGSRIKLTVQKPGYVSKELASITIKPSEPVNIVLEAASNITGIVLSESQEPLPGATVTLVKKIIRGNNTQNRTISSIDTNDEGAFRLEDVAPERYSIIARATGWQDFELTGIEAVKGKNVSGLRLVLSPEALLEGTVLQGDGTPASGAMIQQASEERALWKPGVSRAFSDGAGNYQLHGLAPGKTSVQVRHKDHPFLVKPVELKSGSNRLDIQLESGFEVSGRTIDETGAPVSGVSIMIGSLTGFSQDDGGFKIKGIPNGTHNVGYSKKGYITSYNDQNVTIRNAPVEGLLLELKKGASITGQIIGLDPDRFWQLSVEGYQDSTNDYSAGTVDYQGSYRLGNITPGMWNVTASLAGGGRQAQGHIQIEPGTAETRLDLEFGKGIQLTGSVVMGTEPLPNAWVVASATSVESYGSATTGPDGAFELDGLQAGKHGITVYEHDKGINYREEVDLAGDQQITIRIPQARISGIVQNAVDESPISGVGISAVRNAPEGQLLASPPGVFTDSSGRFEINRIGNGDWKIMASKEGFTSSNTTVSIKDGTDVSGILLSLHPSEGVPFQISFAAGGHPQSLSAAVLDTSGNLLFSKNYTVMERGQVRITGIPPGTWEVVFSAWNEAPTSVMVTAPGESPVVVTLLPASTLKVTIPELTKELSIAKATLTQPDGKPHRIISSWNNTVQTEFQVPAGSLIQTRLPAGTWNVIVTAPDGRRWEKSATTVAGQTTELILE